MLKEYMKKRTKRERKTRRRRRRRRIRRRRRRKGLTRRKVGMREVTKWMRSKRKDRRENTH